MSKRPIVGIIMGSDSDWPTMKKAAAILRQMKIPFESRVVSAHRTPHEMVRYAMSSEDRGLQVIIAGAGGAAHLPGMVASLTLLPVIGVPIETRSLKGLDSLLSIAQMPRGVPVATVAIGNSENAALLAARIVASLGNKTIKNELSKYRSTQRRKSKRTTLGRRANKKTTANQ